MKQKLNIWQRGISLLLAGWWPARVIHPPRWLQSHGRAADYP
jgi:hypothetical protein